MRYERPCNELMFEMEVNDETLKLLRENNYMLKQIIQYINANGHQSNDFKEFMINVMANGI